MMFFEVVCGGIEGVLREVLFGEEIVVVLLLAC